MGWLATDEIRNSFNLSQMFKVDDDQIKFASRLAGNDIRGWIEPDDYVLATAEAAPTGTKEVVTRERIQDAHALLTVSKLLLTQTQIRSSGVVTQERDEASSTTNQYLDPAKLENLRSQYEREAKALLAPYMLTGSTANSMGTLSIGSSWD